MVDPVPFQTTLRDLANWLGRSHAPYCVIGGVAASLLGRPRYTRDVDVLILLESERWKDLLHDGNAFHFTPRINDALTFAERSRVLLMRHTPSSVDVDVVCGLLPYEAEVIRRASEYPLPGVSIRVPAIEDLVFMKAVAGRPRDWLDIDGLSSANPHLNVPRVLALAQAYDEALGEDQLTSRLRSALAGGRRGYP